MNCHNRNRIAVFSGFFLALFAIDNGSTFAAGPEPTEEEIFQKVFGKRKKEEIKAPIAMPVLYEKNPQPLGQVDVRLGSTPDDVSLDGEALKSILDRLLDSSVQFNPMEITGTALTEVKPQNKWVPLSYFRTTLYQITYDEKKLELHLTIPAQIRKKGAISFGGRDEYGPGIEPDTFPSWFSAYFNLTSSQDYELGSDPATGGRQPMRGLVENGTRLGDVVFEGSVAYYENKYALQDWDTFARQDFRLVKDFPAQQLRAFAGDLPLAVQGFQSAVQLGGAGIVSKTGLDPTRQTTQGGRYEIFLERPSKVTATLNGFPIRTIDLPAGRHDLTDFSFVAGPNNLKFEIVDDLGRKDERNFSFFSSSELLGKGFHEMGYFVGAPSQQDGFNRAYDRSKMTGSFYHRYGYSDSFTLGANLQIRAGDALAGAGAAVTSSVGSLSLEPALSTGTEKPKGFALRTRFSTVDYGGPRKSQRSYALGVVSMSPGFSSFGSPAGFQAVAHTLTGSFGQSLGDLSALSMGINYAFIRPTGTALYDTFGISVGVSRSWRKGPSASLSLREDRNSAGQMETSAAIFVNWSFPDDHQAVSVGYNAKDDATNMGWSYSSPEPGVGRHDLRLGVKKAGDNREFSGSGSYTGNRGVIGVNHSAKWLPPQDVSVTDSSGQRRLTQQSVGPQNRFSIQAQTALVFVGGRFGIGRPVLDSFSLVSTEKNMAGDTIYINRKADGSAYYAKSSELGGAVMPEISSYSPFTLQVAPDDSTTAVKAGFERDTFRFLPPYKSGYLVKLGTDLHISVGANLLYEDDSSPVITQPGWISSVSDEDFKKVLFFTSRSGRARIEGFKPGQYELHLADGSTEKYTFTIPEDAPDYINMGKIKLKRLVKQ